MTDLLVTADGLVAVRDDAPRALPADHTLDRLLADADPVGRLERWYDAGRPRGPVAAEELVAPIGSQEVWAAGVTYLRSRAARMAESRDAGGGEFYDRVYDAERPELFFKATPHRVVGPGGGVRIRRDSTWDVPEPELTLVVSAHGQIIGYTAGNDVSSRSIEGENPLYLPQAKVYAGCAALGPRLVITSALPGPSTGITMTISRGGKVVFTGGTTLARLRRPLTELVEYLFRDSEFPCGVFLMTGTGIVPDDGFTLAPGDEVAISVDGVGTLVNPVVRAG
ncbi:MAG: fumarylacetoacetate hydrolase family protein [Frankia sp.]|nr:fumarylacetoacetate hydrolase family protein [Frankia sp.]